MKNKRKKRVKDAYIVVLISFKNMTSARTIARYLLKKRLAACCNLVTPVESLFWWEGKIQVEKEALALIKTKKSKFGLLVGEVKKKHSYQVPEILALTILKGNSAYLKWIEEVLF